MPNPFEVALDNTGRIVEFIPVDHPDEPISPEDIGERLDGGERVLINDVEYDLTEGGSLIHPDVEIVASVALLGSGIRLDQGTVFRPEAGASGLSAWIGIGSRTRIKGTEIQGQVDIADHAFIHARSVGRRTMIGSYVRIGTGTEIGSEVDIAKTVKIDVESTIGRGVIIGENARLGFNTRVGAGAVIGARARIGTFTGAGPRGVNQDGPLIRPGQIVPPSTRITE